MNWLGFGTQIRSGCYHANVNVVVLFLVKKKSEPLLDETKFPHWQCEECGTKEDYQPKFVRGEPQNITLIGHWDGWQPFGAPGQHSCGKLLFLLF